MTEKTKRPNSLWIVLTLIPLLIALYFFDNIKGYYQFRQYCKDEGGLRIYELLEKDVGWLAKDYIDAKSASLIDGVGFVRFTDLKKDGGYYDLKYIGGNPQLDSSFESSPYDHSKKVKYIWKNSVNLVNGKSRLSKVSYEVINIKENKISVGYYRFSYSIFDSNNSLLGAPSSVFCFHYPARSAKEVSGWRKAINTTFINLEK